MTALPAKVQQTIDRHKMLERGDSVLVALSGGPDSVALLHVLIALNGERTWHAAPIRIAAAHLDHGLRKGSAKDREFCRALCRRLKVRFHSRRLDIAALARRRKISVEEAGRAARYEYFESLASRHGYTKIATGHTLDDTAETVLFNIARGAGLPGLAGIPPVRGRVIRPLIACEKSELLAYLEYNRIAYRHDPTNVTLAYTRNKIRHAVIPALLEINPAVRKNIARLSEIVAEELEYLRSSSVSAYKLAVLREGKTKIVLDLELLDRYHKSLRKKVLAEAVRRLTAAPTGLPSNVLERALGVLDGKSGGRVSLVPGVYMEKSAGRVAVARESASPRAIRLRMPGRTALPLGDSFLLSSVKPEGDIREFDITNRSAFLDRERVRNPVVRFWRRGDKIRPLGMRGHRLLSDVFIDRRIPEFERGSIPLVVSGRKIAWVAGVMISDDFKITPRTKKVLKIELCEP